MGANLPVNLILNWDGSWKGPSYFKGRFLSFSVCTREAESQGPSPVVAPGLSGGGVLRSLDSQAGRPLGPSSPTHRCLMPPKFQRALLPESGCLSSPLIIKCCCLTFIQIDVVLPFFLVPGAVVSGALEDVSPVPNVMPDGHLL